MARQTITAFTETGPAPEGKYVRYFNFSRDGDGVEFIARHEDGDTHVVIRLTEAEWRRVREEILERG